MTHFVPMLSHSPSSASLVNDIDVQRQSVVKRLSSSSVKSIADIIAGAASSASSLFLPEGEVEVVTTDGVRHCDTKLNARYYKTPSFASDLLLAVRQLHAPSWSNPKITAQGIKVQKVSGSLTNAVFFVSYPDISDTITLLLRIYGPSSGSLISRPRELHTLHILSSQYNIGPLVYGTFQNGRIEEYFESTTLTAADLRDPLISGWIGAQMAGLHSVNIELIEAACADPHTKRVDWDIGAKANIKFWLSPASEVTVLPDFSPAVREEIDLPRFRQEWATYLRWVSDSEDISRGSRRVFAHNDTQYGNLLRIKSFNDKLPGHRQIIVVDFEYASPNPASYDIANHFQEWTANYHGPTPHILDHAKYPTLAERQNFYKSYLTHAAGLTRNTLSETELQEQIRDMDEQVRIWSPATHAVWAIWGLVQARDDIEGKVEQPEFDYIGYSLCRMQGFRRELQQLGIL